jgi:heme A synthase
MSEHYSSSNRPLWLAIILIVAVLVAAGTGVLFHMTGADAISTLAGAAAAFVTTVTLSLAVSRFLTG